MEQGLILLLQWIIEYAPIIQQFNTAISSKSSLQEFEQNKLLQQHLAAYQRDTQLTIAIQEQETAIRLAEFNKILENWPLKLYPSQLLESDQSYKTVPLKIFLAPLELKSEVFSNTVGQIPELESKLAEGIRAFLNTNYALYSQTRATEFLAGAWEKQRFYGESSIKSLFHILKSEPVLILESEVNGDDLLFRIAYWGFCQKKYYYKTIFKLSYRQAIYEAVRTRTLEWRKIREQLLELGESLEDIDKLGGDNVINLAILEKEEAWKSQGIDVSKLSLRYQVNSQDLETFCQFLIVCHCLVASWIADIYHSMQSNAPPLLPDLLPDLLQNTINLQPTPESISNYQHLYQTLKNEQISQIDLIKPQQQTALLYTLAGHSGKVSAIAINSDRQILTSSSEDQTIKVWSLKTGKLIRSINKRVGEVSSIGLSPDGQLLVTGSYDCPRNNIKVWQLDSGKLLHTLLGHRKPIHCIAISPNGHLLASGSNKIKTWNLHTGERLCTLWHSCSVNSAAIDANGTILASGSSDNKIRIWQPRTGELLRTLIGHTGEVRAIALSADGKILASGSADKTIKIWHVPTNKLVCNFNGHTDEVRAVALSADGKILASGSADKTIKVWQLSLSY